jgi:hypothetical protein
LIRSRYFKQLNKRKGMKVKAIITLFLCFAILGSFCQSPYYDALFLRNLLTPANTANGQIVINNAVKARLELYYGPLPKFASQSAIDAFFVANPYFRSSANPSQSLFTQAAALGLVPFPNLLSAAGELDVTNLADGFAKFLVERTKEELNIAFFEKFKKRIHEGGFEDAVILFPQTCSTLDAIGDQIYNYEAYIGSLRESFEADINGLLTNLPTAINDGRYNVYFTAHPVLKSTCLSAAYIGNGLLKKVHPGQILADFDVTILNGFNPSVRPTIETIQLFSESFRSISTDHYWVDKDSVSILLNDPIALQIYFGLLYQKAGSLGISFGGNTLQSVLSANVSPAVITNANNFIRGFISQTTTLTQNIRNIAGKERDKISFTDYYAFYTSALDIFEYTKKISTFPGLNALVLGPDFDKFLQIARTGGNVALAINRKNYSSVIINTYQLYNFAFTSVSNDRMNNRFKNFLLRYGSFVASVAQAENPDDVKNAIEAAVLPSGSSRIKRETPFNVSLNAYMGLFIGHEKIKNIDDGRTFNTYGVTAPIGVAISRGHSIFFFGTGENGWEKSKYGWSSSLFLSLIDLGTVAAYRFKDDKAEQVPTIQLKHIFSPGAFISTGIPRTPLSLNLGAQVGPTLRKIVTGPGTSNDVSSNTYWRFSASLCVDIPLLNFYTSSK